MRRRLLQMLMAAVTLFTVANLLVSLHALRAQEGAMDAMMRSYVLDLAENFSSFPGPQEQSHRGRMARMVVPWPMALCKWNWPPSSSTRSRIPTRPSRV